MAKTKILCSPAWTLSSHESGSRSSGDRWHLEDSTEPGWFCPSQTGREERIDAETAARLALIQGAGGLLLFGTAAISFLNLRATQRDVEIAESKQVTDRFSKAVEMLGNENSVYIRLGGVYALERIANDAKDSDQDYWQVMEVLTAYVREKAKQSPQPEQALSYTLPTIFRQCSRSYSGASTVMAMERSMVLT
jgi:hypothetical protein